MLSFIGVYVWAQPYKAAAGFDTPLNIADSSRISEISLAHDGEEVYAYWFDQDGVLRQRVDVEAEPERLLQDRTIRSVSTTSVQNEPAYAWVTRSLSTGKSVHAVHWQGETRVLLEAAAPRSFQVFAGEREPVVIYTEARDTNTFIILKAWSGDERVLHSSPQGFSGIDFLLDDAGHYHLSFLEGFTDRRTNASNWFAYYLFVPLGGNANEPVLLGSAARQGISDISRLSLVEGKPYIMWSFENEESRRRAVFTGRSSVALGIAEPNKSPRLLTERSYPLGVIDGYIYWVSDDSIRRLALDAQTTNADVSESVIWSPYRIERAEILSCDGNQFIAWYGPKRIDDYALFVANDLKAFSPSLFDRIAARMGWNPWDVWQAFFGQALGSLLLGILASVLLVPVFWFLSMLLSRLVSSAGSTVILGIGLSTVSMTSFMYLLAWFPNSMRLKSAGLPATPLELSLGFFFAAVFTWLIRHRADSDKQMGLLMSSVLNTFFAMTFLTFLNFNSWLNSWFSFI